MADTFDPNNPFADNFSFEVVDSPEENVRAAVGKMETQKEVAIRLYGQKMKEVEGMILPLLNNLLKNPDKEYIKWGNRTEAINKQITKITAVTRKPLELL